MTNTDVSVYKCLQSVQSRYPQEQEMWGQVDHLLNAFLAELISCLEGVQAAINLGIGRLILETDALMVQQALSSEAYSATSEAGVEEERKSLVASNFLSFD